MSDLASSPSGIYILVAGRGFYKYKEDDFDYVSSPGSEFRQWRADIHNSEEPRLAIAGCGAFLYIQQDYNTFH